MKKHLITIIFSAALFLISTPSLFAQPGFDDDVVDTPIDGGLSLLVAAGIGYGVKQMKDARKKKQNSENKMI